jgi:hypothetical protein
MDEYECVNGCDLRGEKIPEESKDYYSSETTHYSRMIGIDGGRSGIYDGVIAWTCPDCNVVWNRFSKEDKRRYEMTEDFIGKMVESGKYTRAGDTDSTSAPQGD